MTTGSFEERIGMKNEKLYKTKRTKKNEEQKKIEVKSNEESLMKSNL